MYNLACYGKVESSRSKDARTAAREVFHFYLLLFIIFTFYFIILFLSIYILYIFLMLFLLPAAMLLFYVKHFELFCTIEMCYTNKFDFDFDF